LNKKFIKLIKNDNSELIINFSHFYINLNSLSDNLSVLEFKNKNQNYLFELPYILKQLILKRKVLNHLFFITNKSSVKLNLSYGESKIYPWSLKKTLREYSQITFILFEKAIKKLIINKEISLQDHHYPSNDSNDSNANTKKINILDVIFFIFSINFLKLKRLIYGLFFEKKWIVFRGKMNFKPLDLPSYFKNLNYESNLINSLPINSKFSFYADPFLLKNEIIVEALEKSSGKGKLICIDSNHGKILYNFSENLKIKKHLSYPYTIKSKDQFFIYPETGDFKNKKLINFKSFNNIKLNSNYKLKGLIDPSVINHKNIWYLFGNHRDEPCTLRLWYSKDPKFVDVLEHPLSPVYISPYGGRMGGRIFSYEGNLFRFGQDFTDSYGNGLILYKIKSLSSTYFEEEFISEIKVKSHFKGPHNIDFNNEIIVWDQYINGFDLFAGLRRVLSKL
tara:strand:+ start:489 stop:1838 length:1350 start_codon:yes stop_codon:yes gene_type:complete